MHPKIRCDGECEKFCKIFCKLNWTFVALVICDFAKCPTKRLPTNSLITLRVGANLIQLKFESQAGMRKFEALLNRSSEGNELN